MINRLKNKLFEEIVFFIALFMATATGFFAKFNLDAIDFNVIGILLALMLITLAFEKYGILERAAVWVLEKADSERKTALVMTLLTAILAMLITNDVALITVVPITIILSKKAGFDPFKVIVLEALSANIGSSLTPFGNPQNLYLYNRYAFEFGEFIWTITPFVTLGILALMLPIWKLSKEKFGKIHIENTGKSSQWVYVYLGLFLITIICIVFRFSIGYILAGISLFVLVKDRELIKNVDYFLLGTFVCFFIFIDHINQFEWLKEMIRQLLHSDLSIFLSGAVLSQGISNVPAAILLSAFVTEPSALLVGVSVGGLGTMVASLANLIAFKYYAKFYRTGNYHKYFVRLNFALLVFFVIVFSSVYWQ